MHQQLVECPFSAVSWELPPLTPERMQAPFECVLLDNPRLAQVNAEPETFREHYGAGAVAHFTNLRGDSDLIAPVPRPGLQGAHLLDWARSCTPEEAAELWSTVAFALQTRLSSAPTWLSTAGMGVYWLHVRLDPKPKYYRHQPYRTSPTS